MCKSMKPKAVEVVEQFWSLMTIPTFATTLPVVKNSTSQREPAATDSNASGCATPEPAGGIVRIAPGGTIGGSGI